MNVCFQTGAYWDNGIISCTHVLVYFPNTNLETNGNITNFFLLFKWSSSVGITCDYILEIAFYDSMCIVTAMNGYKQFRLNKIDWYLGKIKSETLVILQIDFYLFSCSSQKSRLAYICTRPIFTQIQ